MKARYWIGLIILGGILIAGYGVSIHDFGFFVMEVMGAFGLSFGYSWVSDDRDYNKDKKRLEKENKYRKSIICSNCGTSHSFEVVKGVCMLEFLTDKKCKNCSCELKADKITGTSTRSET